MQVDSRLNDVDDCLYRVAVRVLVVKEGSVLLVKEAEDDWWALPGGGIDHGETIEATLRREVGEELGVPSANISSDFKIAYYNIGQVVNGVPRMNIFFKASVPEEMLKKTTEIADWAWFSEDEFMSADLHSSFDKNELAKAIFSK